MTNTIPNKGLHEINFIGSFPNVSKAPVSDLPEFAFAGRSNVGKSSLINFLCGRKKLAKTSSTPGKTQMINLFQIEDKWMLADLPGYGYARVSKKTRGKWNKMIRDYLEQRKNLFVVFQLIDIRIPPQKSDLENMNWMGEHGIPFVIVFTKADRKYEKYVNKQISQFMDTLLETWEYPPKYFLTSTQDKKGREELLEFILGHAK